jgi:hypothetical protein
MKAIRRPSGDHCGYSPQIDVIRCGSDPSAFITHRRWWGAPRKAPRTELKTMCRPSGDQVGPQLASSGRLVRSANPEPFAFTTPMSSPADRKMRKTRRRPSGDHCAELAAPWKRAMAGEEIRCRCPPGDPVHRVSAGEMSSVTPGGAAQSNTRTPGGGSGSGVMRAMKPLSTDAQMLPNPKATSVTGPPAWMVWVTFSVAGSTRMIRSSSLSDPHTEAELAHSEPAPSTGQIGPKGMSTARRTFAVLGSASSRREPCASATWIAWSPMTTPCGPKRRGTRATTSRVAASIFARKPS